MKIELEQIGTSNNPFCFRLAFHSSVDRCLLQYPNPYGLQFLDKMNERAAQWCTPLFGQFPLDDFVLNPRQRIMFDLLVKVNDEAGDNQGWKIQLDPGKYMVTYQYHVDRETDWYDFLAKRSRFAGITPIWRGTENSNSIEIEVASPNKHAKE